MVLDKDGLFGASERAMDSERPTRTYSLERLYFDQHRDFVIDTIPALLSWIAPSARATQPIAFEVASTPSVKRQSELLKLSWKMDALVDQDATLQERARRLRRGTSAQREHVVELAAYGLALVAISVWLPGRRVVGWSKHSTPDMLLDASPGALRGVEVAGRSKGGLAALITALAEKRSALERMSDVKEAHVSLWCGSPRVSLFVQVKP